MDTIDNDKLIDRRREVDYAAEARSIEARSTRVKLAQMVMYELTAAEDKADGNVTLEEAFRQRYRMPGSVVAMLKLAGAEAAMKLVELIEKLDTLTAGDAVKLKAIELALDKAFGRGETASALAIASTKITPEGAGGKSISKQLEEIEDNGDFDPPELRKAQSAKTVGEMTFPQPERVAAGVERRPALVSEDGERKVIHLTRADIPRFSA